MSIIQLLTLRLRETLSSETLLLGCGTWMCKGITMMLQAKKRLHSPLKTLTNSGSMISTDQSLDTLLSLPTPTLSPKNLKLFLNLIVHLQESGHLTLFQPRVSKSSQGLTEKLKKLLNLPILKSSSLT